MDANRAIYAPNYIFVLIEDTSNAPLYIELLYRFLN
jgi:hypothetical protein